MTTNRGRVLKAADVASAPDVRVGSNAFAPDRAERDDTTAVDADVAIELPEARAKTIDLDQIRAEAHEEGRAAALAEIGLQLDAVASRLSEISSTASTVLDSAVRSERDQIVSAAVDMAKWILDRELADPESVIDLADRALGQIDGHEILRIRVHPDLVDTIGRVAPPDVRVVGDPSLSRGEVEAETDGPRVSLRIDEALDRASRLLQTEVNDGTR